MYLQLWVPVGYIDFHLNVYNCTILGAKIIIICYFYFTLMKVRNINVLRFASVKNCC